MEKMGNVQAIREERCKWGKCYINIIGFHFYYFFKLLSQKGYRKVIFSKKFPLHPSPLNPTNLGGKYHEPCIY